MQCFAADNNDGGVVGAEWRGDEGGAMGAERAGGPGAGRYRADAVEAPVRHGCIPFVKRG
ncbi:hypothetical protein C6P98_28635 [Burkholderia multivorans]|uniref:Uncharacterized protein n=1 Tax=Burkholderia multivorans TaxID=87883 RepID=A0A8E2RTF9_9BURK|nr:hypothetical protein C6P98_28635 [Burkholderia multivorans]